MTTFIYKAKKNNAETVAGQISARDHDEAVELISQLGLTPVLVVAKEGNNTSEGLVFRGVKSKDLYLFSRQLTNLLKSGVSLLRSLNIIEEQTQNNNLKGIISRICSEIKNGKSFSDSLALFPNVFSSLFVTLVKAGEESGNLREILENIASYQKTQDETMSKVKTALTYPVFMGGIGLATIYFILSFVVPKMGVLFASLKNNLPLPTKILLSLGTVFSQYWFLILLVVAVFSFLVYRLGKSKKNKAFYSRMLLQAPLYGEVILKTDLSRFCRTMVLLLKGGVSLIKSIETAIPILNNEVVKDDLRKCQEDLTSGGSFGESLKKSKEIPPMMAHLVSIAEESGNINEVLSEIADTYEQETAEKMKVMTTLLEPIMILTVGLIVGFIVFAILLPIFQVDVFAY